MTKLSFIQDIPETSKMTISEAFFSSAACAANRAFARDSRVIAVTLLPSYLCTTNSHFVLYLIGLLSFKDTISSTRDGSMFHQQASQMSTKFYASNIGFEYK